MNPTRGGDGGPGGQMVWAAGLVVATAAGVATAHGLYQVAVAAHVPAAVGWLYPLITDGLALLGYAATTRLTHRTSRRYAAAIVILAAGLSGLAQAVNLTGSITHTTTGAPTGLRFGVGAWPAIAAALTAHLLHLLHADADAGRLDEHGPTDVSAVHSVVVGSVEASTTPSLTASNPAVQPYNPPGPIERHPAGCTRAELDEPAVQQRCSTRSEPSITADRDHAPRRADTAVPARDRARQAAHAHLARHGALPTVSQLVQQTAVARGTAGTVLKELRDARPALHLVDPGTQTRTHR